MIINSKKFCLPSIFLFSTILLYYSYGYPQSTANIFQACKDVVMNADGYPGGSLGGGKGYNKIINQNEADYLVNDFNSLQNALTNPNDVNGDGKIIIYIDDNAMINITNEPKIIGDSENDCHKGQCGLEVPGNVIIASGRGRNGSPGAIIYTNHFDDGAGLYNIFKVIGSNARITGLRLRGSDTEIKKDPENDPNWSVYKYTLYRGIVSNDNLEVDNCELSGFAHAAILVNASKGVRIHHNYIHHNRRDGLGYGICHVIDSETEIYANIFDYNRHCITGDGHCEQIYTATYNLVLWNGNDSSFDMHGNGVMGHGGDHEDCDCMAAGNTIRINYNTFLNANVNCIRIRGNPVVGCYISNNKFIKSEIVVNRIRQDCDGDTEKCGEYSECDLLDPSKIITSNNDWNYIPPSTCNYCDPRPCQSDSCLNDEFPDHCISGNCDD